MRSTIAMIVKTPRTAVGIVRTMGLSVITCVLEKFEEEQTSNAIHLGAAIPKTVE